MERSLRLLIAEDSEDDCLLLVRGLEKNGYAVEHSRVDSEGGLMEALSQSGWDLIISDHVMPGFSSARVLETVHQGKFDIPVIIVSGSIGEEVAVEAMKTGASDYIMKDNLRRLAPAIERELKEAENRRARRRAEDQLRHMAFHDALTGLTNRYKFENALEKLLHASREQGAEHGFLYLDLDQFKIVNDTCGHIAGDELLRQLSMILKKHVREHDTLARLGGDEFGVLLENCPLQRAFQIAEDMLAEINQFRFVWGGRSFSLGVSIGLVQIDARHTSTVQIMSQADLACYAAKDVGRNRIYVFEEDDKKLVRQVGEMQWVNHINSALEEGRFIIYSQSIKSLKPGANICFNEFLVRLKSEDGEIILPGTFIPAAERFNIMPELDRYIIDRVFAYLAEKRDEHDQYDDFMAFINLSGLTINDSTISTFIREKITETRINPQHICFEVTETAAIINLALASSFIEQVKNLGCRFALDDFGSGMSSFSYLKSLPVDFLKIDGEFVKDMIENPMNAAIVESINRIGHVAGIKTIGEYAETPQIVKRLSELGVDYAQGYGLDVPRSI